MAKDPPFLHQLSALEQSLQQQSVSISVTQENQENIGILLDFIKEVQTMQHILPATIENGQLKAVDTNILNAKEIPRNKYEEYAHVINFIDSLHDHYRPLVQLLKEISGRDTLSLRTPDKQYASIAVGQLADNIQDYVYYVIDEHQNKEDLRILSMPASKTFSELLAVYRDEMWKSGAQQYDTFLGTVIDYLDASGAEVIASDGRLEISIPDMMAKPLERLKHHDTEKSWYNDDAKKVQKAGEEIGRYAKHEPHKQAEMFAYADEKSILTDHARAYIHRGIKQLQTMILARSSGHER